MFYELMQMRRLNTNTMANQTRQAELMGDQRRFGKIFTSSYADRLKRYKEILFENGIRQVIWDNVNKQRESLSYDRLTILILPIIENLNRFQTSQISVQINRQFRAIVYPAYEMLDDTCQRITVNHNGVLIPVFDYYNNRNLIISYYNIFPIIPRTRQFESIIQFMVRLINLPNAVNNNNNNSPSIPEQPVIRLSPEEQKKANIKINIDGFIGNVKRSYIELQRDIEQKRKDIDDYGRKITDAIKTIELKSVSLESVKKIVDGVEGGFEEKVSELKTLPFIKDVEILKTGIKLDYGEIYIDDVYIGKMYCIITPTEIKFFNIDNMKLGCAHPHINGSHPCFGNSTDQVYKLLGEMNFKQLGFLIGQYLRTYSPKGTPYQDIKAWRDKEKK